MFRSTKEGLILGFILGAWIGSEFWGGNTSGGSIMAILGGVVFAPLGAIGAIVLRSLFTSKGRDSE